MDIWGEYMQCHNVLLCSSITLHLPPPHFLHALCFNQTALSPNATSRIVGWIVQYRPSNIENDTIVNITDPSTQLHVISSLDAGTEYCVRIAGDTLMGVGPFTDYQKMSTIFFCKLYFHCCKFHAYA